MLVLAEEPRIDLIIKIAGAHGGDGAHASIIQKDGTGQWMERGAFDDADAPPHSDEVEVDLSDPDRIVMTPGPGRRCQLLAATRVRDSLFAGGERTGAKSQLLAWARKRGSRLPNRERIDPGDMPFTLLALNLDSAKRAPLPFDIHEGTHLVVRPDRVTVLKKSAMKAVERSPLRHLESVGFSLGQELPWESGTEESATECAVSRSFQGGMNMITDEGLMTFARLWPVDGRWAGVEESNGRGRLIWITPDPFPPMGDCTGL